MEMGTKSGGLVFLALLAVIALIEVCWIVYRKKETYPWHEAFASFGVAIIKRGIDFLTAGLAAAITFWAYDNRVATQEITSFWSALVYFLLFELAYYWHHRWAHEIRWLWATHSVHHSPQHMNLTVAARLGWTGLISGSVVVFLPLAFAGYHPVLIFLTLAASLFYQIWLHTEAVRSMGPLEWILNTPSHHRVHHAMNLHYIDKNYGGVLIIFDRLFGTFEAERDKPIYGLVHGHNHLNPIKIALWEWWMMAKDIIKANSYREVFMYLFGRPGWKPDLSLEELNEKEVAEHQ